jgi:hypothetical protein
VTLIDSAAWSPGFALSMDSMVNTAGTNKGLESKGVPAVTEVYRMIVSRYCSPEE